MRVYPNMNADDAGTYSFRWVVVPAAQSFAYTIGTVVSKDSPQVGEGNIESPQAERSEERRVGKEQKPLCDNLQGGPGENCNFTRVLLDPGNASVPGTDGFVCSNICLIAVAGIGTD